MLNFLKKHNHSFEDVIWYVPYCHIGYGIRVYRIKYCSCGKRKKEQLIYDRQNFSWSELEDKINWWKAQGAITEEEFALKYR